MQNVENAHFDPQTTEICPIKLKVPRVSLSNFRESELLNIIDKLCIAYFLIQYIKYIIKPAQEQYLALVDITLSPAILEIVMDMNTHKLI